MGFVKSEGSRDKRRWNGLKRCWGRVCGFFRLILREEGRNSVALVGLTAEHAHTLSSIWFLPNEHQTPLVKSLGHGGKRCLCKSPRSLSSAAKEQNTAASCRATGNWNHLSFRNLPLLFTSHPHASLFLSLHRRLLAKAQATVTEVKLCLVSFLPCSFLASSCHFCSHSERSEWKSSADTPVSDHRDVQIKPLWASSVKLSLSHAHHTKTSSGVIGPGTNRNSEGTLVLI